MINVLIGDKENEENWFEHLVYNILCAAGFNFEIINNLKAEYISVGVHMYCHRRTGRKCRLKGLRTWEDRSIICALFPRLFFSFLCLLLSNYIQMAPSFVFLAIPSEAYCQKSMPSSFWLLPFLFALLTYWDLKNHRICQLCLIPVILLQVDPWMFITKKNKFRIRKSVNGHTNQVWINPALWKCK